MYGKLITRTAGAIFSTVTNASQALSTTLVAGKVYQFASNTNCFIKQGTGAQTAAAAADNVFVPANTPFLIHGSNGDNISVIRDTADGKCTLHLVDQI